MHIRDTPWDTRIPAESTALRPPSKPSLRSTGPQSVFVLRMPTPGAATSTVVAPPLSRASVPRWSARLRRSGGRPAACRACSAEHRCSSPRSPRQRPDRVVVARDGERVAQELITETGRATGAQIDHVGALLGRVDDAIADPRARPPRRSRRARTAINDASGAAGDADAVAGLRGGGARTTWVPWNA